MSLSSSLYAGISGLTTMGNGMSVLGNNVSNINTVAFKSSRSTFQDVLTQSVATAAGSAQIGRGVTLTTVDGLFAQGSFESTANPTDMAIGGAGFFMLRASDSAEADMYTRAGEFRFNTQGYLINPIGHFVQGWEVDAITGQTRGTIGDINLGRSTPPVASQQVDMIVNLDSRFPRETVEQRLFDSWNGTNVAGVNPSAPIATANFDYTTSIKVFDSKGAAHDVTVYFDRSTQENQWEFLVTVDPRSDMRSLSAVERLVYAPNERFNHEQHRGAGALMYGVIDFNTAGAIVATSAWNVPPDGRVDPAQNINRITLSPTDNYYSFAANFTGDAVNQLIRLNFGARYSALPTNLSQRLVSDIGAFADPGAVIPANRETLFRSVHNFNGEPLFSATSPTTIRWTGFQNDGRAVSGTFTIGIGDGNERLQNFLTAFGASFSATATLDPRGRLVLTDNTPGSSGMFVNSFVVERGGLPLTSPFGNQINVTTSKREVVSPGRATTGAANTPPVISADTIWGVGTTGFVFGSAGALVAHNDTIRFSGTRGDGSMVTPQAYTINFNAVPPQTVRSFLDSIEAAFGADAFIDRAGRLVLRDRVADADRPGGVSSLAFRIDSYTAGPGGPVRPAIFGPATPNFETIAGSTIEKGSLMGSTTSRAFVTEALSSTQYANSSTTIFQDQDGYAAGFLQSVSVNPAGIITGHYSNGQVLMRAQVVLANFSNLQGLHKVGGNIFRATSQSGAPVTGVPGTIGLGSIAPNALEMSNVDLGTEFVKLITTQRGFQANSRIITTTDEMLNELINIRR